MMLKSVRKNIADAAAKGDTPEIYEWHQWLKPKTTTSFKIERIKIKKKDAGSWNLWLKNPETEKIALEYFLTQLETVFHFSRLKPLVSREIISRVEKVKTNPFFFNFRNSSIISYSLPDENSQIIYSYKDFFSLSCPVSYSLKTFMYFDPVQSVRVSSYAIHEAALLAEYSFNFAEAHTTPNLLFDYKKRPPRIKGIAIVEKTPEIKRINIYGIQAEVMSFDIRGKGAAVSENLAELTPEVKNIELLESSRFTFRQNISEIIKVPLSVSVPDISALSVILESLISQTIKHEDFRLPHSGTLYTVFPELNDRAEILPFQTNFSFRNSGDSAILSHSTFIKAPSIVSRPCKLKQTKSDRFDFKLPVSDILKNLLEDPSGEFSEKLQPSAKLAGEDPVYISDQIKTKWETYFWLALSEEQKTAYDQILYEGREKIKTLIETGNPFAIDSNINILILNLKQVLNKCKTELFSAHAGEMLKEGKKILIISDYEIQGIRLIEQQLSLLGIRYLTICNPKDIFYAQSLLKEFDSDPSSAIIVYSKSIKKEFQIKKLDCIIHFDQPWNPLIKLQTEHQISESVKNKNKPVSIYDYMVRDTIDESILLFLYKRGWYNENELSRITPAKLSQMITTEEWFYILGVEF